MRTGHRITLAAVLLVAATGGTWWWMRCPPPPNMTDAAGSVPAKVETMVPSAMAGGADFPMPALAIGEYRADNAGLPPIDAPLALQIPALRDAAARGNATAACRLAVIGSQCIRARATSVSVTPEQFAGLARQIAENLRQQYAHVSLEGLPERYRVYAQRRLDAEAFQELDRFQNLDAWGRRCGDVPPIGDDEILASLRQAALAGEPASMVSYASGMWMAEFSTNNFLSGFGGSGPVGGWLRSPGFDQWRREAAAVRRTGLERGDPEMLWFEFAFSGYSQSVVVRTRRLSVCRRTLIRNSRLTRAL